MTPKLVCFDSWYGSIDNLKQVRSLGWHFLTRLKANRRIRVAGGKLQAVSEAGLCGGNDLKNFTESYWSTPEIALDEAEQNGFEIISRAGAESFAGGMAENPQIYENIVCTAAETAELPQFRDCIDHLQIVVRKG